MFTFVDSESVTFLVLLTTLYFSDWESLLKDLS